MRRNEILRLGLLVLASLAFGIGTSVLKGNGDGIRAAIGNTSAPWLVLPFVVGAVAGRGRVALGAILGLVLSMLALAGFYAADTFVLQLGPHPWLVDLRLTFQGGHHFFFFAIFSGPVFGGLGAWWSRTKSVVIPVGVAVLFVFEPVVKLARHYSGSGIVSVGELLVGFVAALLVMRFAPRNVPSS